jgi:hypothetical protein
MFVGVIVYKEGFEMLLCAMAGIEIEKFACDELPWSDVIPLGPNPIPLGCILSGFAYNRWRSSVTTLINGFSNI